MIDSQVPPETSRSLPTTPQSTSAVTDVKVKGLSTNTMEEELGLEEIAENTRAYVRGEADVPYITRNPVFQEFELKGYILRTDCLSLSFRNKICSMYLGPGISSSLAAPNLITDTD